MTEEVFSEYIDSIIMKRAETIFSPPSLLIMDQATPHKTEVVQCINNMQSLLLPAGCTLLVQPLDVSLNMPFKSYMREFWKNWIDLPEDQHVLIKQGKRQRVSKTKSFNNICHFLRY